MISVPEPGTESFLFAETAVRVGQPWEAVQSVTTSALEEALSASIAVASTVLLIGVSTQLWRHRTLVLRGDERKDGPRFDWTLDGRAWERYGYPF